MTRMESMAFHSAEKRVGGQGLLFLIIYLSCIFFPPVASRTCDLEAKWIKNKTKQLKICTCPNSVHLQSIVEKEEKPINWRSATQVLGSQFFSSAFTSFFSSSFLSASFFSSEALPFTESSSSFSATLFALSVLSVAKLKFYIKLYAKSTKKRLWQFSHNIHAILTYTSTQS